MFSHTGLFRIWLNNLMKVIAIYPGRFSPFHLGHKSVYDALVRQFGVDNVYIATSDKVDPPRSPFNFAEKQQIIAATGIDPSRVVQTRDPYKAQEITSQFDPQDTKLLFAVSAKDMADDPRFKSWTKRDGTPAYFQPAPSKVSQMADFDKHGYIFVVPTLDFKVDGKPMRSATEFRREFAAADAATKASMTRGILGTDDPRLVNLLASKITEGRKMKLNDIVSEMSVGAIGSVVMPLGATRRRVKEVIAPVTSAGATRATAPKPPNPTAMSTLAQGAKTASGNTASNTTLSTALSKLSAGSQGPALSQQEREAVSGIAKGIADSDSTEAAKLKALIKPTAPVSEADVGEDKLVKKPGDKKKPEPADVLDHARRAREYTGQKPVKEAAVAESKMAELDMDLDDPELSDREFEKIYGMSRREARETFSRTNTWDFPDVRDPNKKLHEQGVAEGFPHDVDHMPGKTIKHQGTNCTTCNGRKSMYKLGGKLFADNKQGAEKVKCPTCKGTGDKPSVAEGGPFSYGKPPRKGSVAANAAQQRKEQEKNKPPIEPKDQRVGVAKVTKGVAEGHADQQRKIFKKNGEPVGEVGIDRESSPGVGQWYMKCYAYDIDNSGYDSYEEAVAELKHCLKQGVAEGLSEMDKSQTPPGRDGGHQFEPGPKVSKKVIKAVKKDPANHLSDLFAKEYSKKKVKEQGVAEAWSQKYKNSINCSHPKGFSQKAHCAGKRKHSVSEAMEMTCPDCGMCKSHGSLTEIKKGQKDSNGYTKCWPGKHAEGTKKGKNGGQVRNCVPNEGITEVNDYFKRRKDEEDRIAGVKPPAKRTPQQTDYQKRRAQEKAVGEAKQKPSAQERFNTRLKTKHGIDLAAMERQWAERTKKIEAEIEALRKQEQKVSEGYYQTNEGWKSKLAGAALAGAAAFGGAAHAGGMSLPPAGLTPAQAQEFAATQMAGQQAINQHAAQQAGKIDYRKDGPITKSSLGHKLEYGIPVNDKGDFINPNRLPNIHELPMEEQQAMSDAYKTWLKDYLSRWPDARQQPDGSMQAIKPGLAPMYPK